MNAVPQILDLGVTRQTPRGRSDTGGNGSFASTLASQMGGGRRKASSAAAEQINEENRPEKREKPEPSKASKEADGGEKSTESKAGDEPSVDGSGEAKEREEPREEASGEQDASENEEREDEAQAAAADEAVTEGAESGNGLPPGVVPAEPALNRDADGKEAAVRDSARQSRERAAGLELRAVAAADDEGEEEDSSIERVLAGKEKGAGSELARLMGDRPAGERGDALLRDLRLAMRSQNQSSRAATPATATAAAGATPTTATTTQGSAQLSVAVPVRREGWDQAVGQRVVWMARNGVQQAQVQLNPRNMGPIDIRISVQNEQATVSFVANNGATREALESAMPRLREMMSEQGLNLTDSHVSGQDRERQSAAGEGGGRQGFGPGFSDADGEESRELPHDEIIEGNSAIDYFA